MFHLSTGQHTVLPQHLSAGCTVPCILLLALLGKEKLTEHYCHCYTALLSMVQAGYHKNGTVHGKCAQLGVQYYVAYAA